MGYTTEFSGSFKISPSIKEEHVNYINRFSSVRHMKRDVSKLKNIKDEVRVAVKLPIGREGEFFTGEPDPNYLYPTNSIIDHNRPPVTQPGLWCQWVISKDLELTWDGGEKFYNYVEWLQYLIKNFFAPWGYKLNGFVHWRGEEMYDIGTIEIKDNVIQIHYRVFKDK